MGNKRDDIRRLIAHVTELGWRRAGAEEWGALRERFQGVSESALRKTLVDSGVTIGQPWRGVDIQSLEGLEETLVELAHLYPRDPALTRKMVIAAKDKARFASRNSKAAEDKRALKREMVEWMLVWLCDPAMFATWVRLRKEQMIKEQL
jgi:hypothetical protein